MRIRTLGPGEVSLHREVRLRALRESPDAFGETAADAEAQPDSYWEDLTRSVTAPGRHVMFLACEGHAVCGSTYGLLDGERNGAGRIGGMWVDPSRRRQGVGRALLGAAFSWARQRRLDHLGLWVRASNASAIALYRGAGFVATGRQRPLRSDGGLLITEMECALCPGWTTPDELALAEAWSDTRLRVLGLRPHGERQIVKQGSISAVWRQSTATGPEVFVKAVPPLFAPEPPLTEWLSRRWPANVPAVLAIDRQRRWMLTRAVEGVALSEVDSVESWTSTVRTLAKIHIDTVRRAAEVIESGCPIRGVETVPGELEALLAETIPLARRHGAVIADDVVRAAHRRGQALMTDATFLGAAGVPMTLIHGDFNAENVIIAAHDASPVILDWTDGAWSHPFLDLVTFLRGRAAKRVAAHHDALVHAYLFEWSEAGAGPLRRLHEVFTVAQRLSPLYHLGSYRRIFGLGPAAVAEMAEVVPWLLGLLVE